MSSTLTLPAPAKLNLMLHVTGRRADGYHLLQTVFRFIDYGDEIVMTQRKDGLIVRGEGAAGVAPEQDLAVRAARLLQSEARCSLGADLAVSKRIPMGAGLGGGSSDAATVLMGLNRLWGLGLSREDLQALGLRLGADVPVFIFGRNAFAEGIGEQLHAIEIPLSWYLVLTPPVHVATASVFADPKLTRHSNPLTIPAFFAGLGRNDLEPVVRASHPLVDRYLHWLAQYGDARMSGSGSSVFCAFGTEAEAQSVLTQLPDNMTGFIARGLDRHPLYDWLESSASKVSK